MFDNTLQLNLGSEANPELKTFVRINQDSYSSEYRLKDGDLTYTFRIRHQTEKNKVKGQTMGRHNVTVTMIENPSAAYPLGRQFEAYTVVRAPESADEATVLGLSTAVCRFTLDQNSRIANWEA